MKHIKDDTTPSEDESINPARLYGPCTRQDAYVVNTIIEFVPFIFAWILCEFSEIDDGFGQKLLRALVLQYNCLLRSS